MAVSMVCCCDLIVSDMQVALGVRKMFQCKPDGFG